MEKVLAELAKDENLAEEQAKINVQDLELEMLELDQKLDKLLDLYLGNKLNQDEYALKKEKILNSKVEIQEKISDFEQKGFSWLSNHLLQNRQLIFKPVIPYDLAAESTEKADKLREATSVDLTFSIWQRHGESDPASMLEKHVS